MMGDGWIKLRLDERNVKALEEGRACDVSFMRLALGEDGIYELYLECRGPSPLPDVGPAPAVPLA